jgi:hypothetical protein
MKLAISLLAAIVASALTLSAGCVVRTTPAHRHGHPDRHRHQHCHDRGGKHHKRVCHAHPHGPGHH